MGREEESWKRRRSREDEADQEEKKHSPVKKRENEKSSELTSEKLDDLIQRAEPMIDQLNNLYNMFAVGVERLAPMERRKQLDQIMLAIQMTSKSTPASLFKYRAIQSRYFSHKEKWEKILKDMENGKIKKITGVRRPR